MDSKESMVCRRVTLDKKILNMFKKDIIPKLNGLRLKGGAGNTGQDSKIDVRKAIRGLILDLVTALFMFALLFIFMYVIYPKTETNPVKLASTATATFEGVYSAVIQNLPEPIRREIAPCTAFETFAPSLIKYTGMAATAVGTAAAVSIGAPAAAVGTTVASTTGILASITSATVSQAAGIAFTTAGEGGAMYLQCDKRNALFVQGLYAFGTVASGLLVVGVSKTASKVGDFYEKTTSRIDDFYEKIKVIVDAIDDEELKKIPGVSKVLGDSSSARTGSNSGSRRGALGKNTKRKSKPSKKNKKTRRAKRTRRTRRTRRR